LIACAVALSGGSPAKAHLISKLPPSLALPRQAGTRAHASAAQVWGRNALRQPLWTHKKARAQSGGEGGGVLTDWIVSAAAAQGFPVQSTSIPGVAQRTGATTYHIEMAPVVLARDGGSVRRPVLALAPAVGDVDLLVASELMEAGRAVAAGYTAPDRTTTIASTSRSYLVVEKMAMGDGRYDSQRLIAAVQKNSRQALLIDFEGLARQANAMINAVLLGAIAAARALPIPVEAFEAAIRADGKAVEANLRGFRAGWEAATAGAEMSVAAHRHHPPPAADSDLEAEIAAPPAVAREIIAEGVRRLGGYQDRAYARLYLDRLIAVRQADETAAAGGRLLEAAARQLALRMSYEDVIRVAAAKIDPARIARIRHELGTKPGQTLALTEFLKPGIDELCAVLPPWLAAAILKLARRYPALGRAHVAMAVNSRSISGQAPPLAAQDIPFPPRARGNRGMAAADRARGRALRRLRNRNRRMRRPDQRLWRYPSARRRQL
jgi:indolepyruvate ferredoxin oxidoreductase, beta subunit